MCLAAFTCSCQQQASMKDNGNGGNGNGDDQNFQDRRKKMQMPQQTQGGCCEAEKSDLQRNQTAAAPVQPVAPAPEVKVESPK